MPVLKQAPLEAMLFLLYRRKYSVKNAVKEIQLAFGKDMMTPEQVASFYETFKKGDYNVMEASENEKLDMLIKILRQPTLMKLITANLNLKSRLALAQTNQILRTQTYRYPLHINKLFFCIYEDSLLVHTYDGYKLKINAPKERLNGESNEEFAARRKKYLANAQQKLQTLFKFNVVFIKNFQLNHMYEKDDFMTDPMHQMTNRVLRSRITQRKLLNVEIFTCDHFRYFENGLKYLQPGVLKSIEIEMRKAYDYDRSIEIVVSDSIKKSKQFKEAQRFESIQPVNFHQSFSKLLHLKCCDIVVGENLMIEDVVELKERLLRNPDLSHFKLKQNDLDKKKFNEALNTDFNRGWTEFGNLDDSNKKLRIQVTDGRIWFKGPRYQV